MLVLVVDGAPRLIVAGVHVTIVPLTIPDAPTCTVCVGVEPLSPEAVIVALALADERLVGDKVALTPGAPGMTGPAVSVVTGYEATFAQVTWNGAVPLGGVMPVEVVVTIQAG